MPANAYEYFVGRQNAAVVKLLHENHDVAGFVQALLVELTQYAERHGCRYDQIALDNPFFVNDETVQMRIHRRA